MKIDIQDLYRIEKELIENKIALHNRPEKFADKIYPILYGRECEDWLGDERHSELSKFYREKLQQNKIFPKPFLIGFVASLDRVKTFKIQRLSGSIWINFHELIGYKQSSELWLFCFGQDLIYKQIKSSILNTFIFNNVCTQGRRSKNLEEAKLWQEASNHMTLISYSLENHFENNTIFQNIHLLVELTIKAVLLDQKINFKRVHNIHYLVDKLGNISLEDKERFHELMRDFPQFSNTRYSGIDQRFNDIVEMAINVQTFVAEIVKYSSYELNSPIQLVLVES